MKLPFSPSLPPMIAWLLPGLLACLLLPACTAPSDPDDAGVVATSEESSTVHETIESILRVSWNQGIAGSAWVEFSFDDGLWSSSPARAVGTGPQETLLLGVPYETDVTWRVVSTTPEGLSEGSLQLGTTGARPEGLPLPALLVSEPEMLDPQLRFLFTSSDEPDVSGQPEKVWNYILDRLGRVVWSWPTPDDRITLSNRVALDSSSFLIDYNSFFSLFDGGAASTVARIDIEGRELARYETPGLHHPFTDLPDGSIVWNSMQDESETLTRMWPDGSVQELWNCRVFADKYLAWPDRFCGSNTISWQESTNHFLVSLYSNDTVVEIDGASGASLRWFGHGQGSWDFEPRDSAFWWQHGVHFTAAGTLLVSTRASQTAQETVVREYTLDQENEALVQVWSFGEGEGIYAQELGEPHRLSNGNTLHNMGMGGRLREITPDKRVVWDLEFSPGRFLGRSTPIQDLYAFLE